MPERIYVTTTIPYVNARPHLGFALELVQADVLARHRRQRGDEVRFLSGTDDNSLKNVLAAEAEGRPTRELVDRNAAAFEALREPLALSFDDFIRTSRDPRHRPGVERFWRACAAAGDLYRKHYEGLYCVGCEQFHAGPELHSGLCPEHGTTPQPVTEENWFFRLSRYQDQLYELVDSGRLRVEPAARRNEVLGFIAAGLEDFSISRSHTRARGWGIPVPGDPDQTVYVWWDALGNYITALDYATDGPAYRRWWVENRRRVHLLGKGVLRFHAVYWPAMLLSAGEPLPTDILVHDYLTVDGEKISKSTGAAVDPTDLVDDLGNLVNRVVTMVHRYRDGRPPTGAPPDAHRLTSACERAPHLIAAALDGFDFRGATTAVWSIVEEANRYVEHARPWALYKAERDGDDRAKASLDGTLDVLLRACRALAEQIRPFLPDAAGRIDVQCTPSAGRLPEPRPLFPRLTPTAVTGARTSPDRCGTG